MCSTQTHNFQSHFGYSTTTKSSRYFPPTINIQYVGVFCSATNALSMLLCTCCVHIHSTCVHYLTTILSSRIQRLRTAAKTMGRLAQQHCQQRQTQSSTTTATAATVHLRIAQRCYRHRHDWPGRRPANRRTTPRKPRITECRHPLPVVRRCARIPWRVDVVVQQLVGRERRQKRTQNRIHDDQRQRQNHHVQTGIVDWRPTA